MKWNVSCVFVLLVLSFSIHAQSVFRLELKASEMTITGLSKPLPDGFYALYSGGQFAKEFKIPTAGKYQFHVLAYGRPMGTQDWPEVKLFVNGDYAGTALINVRAKGATRFSFIAPLTAGQNNLVLKYTNDAANANEDKNLYLKSITITPADAPLTIQLAHVSLHDGFSKPLPTGGLAQYTNGKVEAPVNFPGPQAQDYQFLLRAWGRPYTPHRLVSTSGPDFDSKEWPLVEILIDNAVRATVTVDSSLPLFAQLRISSITPGVHQVAVYFSNDKSGAGEDLNLYMDTLSIAPVKPEAPVRREYFGMHVNQAGHLADASAGTNFGALRLWDMAGTWKNTDKGIVDNSQKYNWSALDTYVDFALTHGAEAHYVFGYPPESVCAAPSGPTPYTNNCVPNEADFKRYATDLTAHLGDEVTQFEVWNEPNGGLNGGRFWNGNAQDLARLAQAVYPILKQCKNGVCDARYRVSSPGVSDRSMIAWLRDYYAAGGDQVTDIVAFHGYPYTDISSGNIAAEDILSQIAEVRSVTQEFGLTDRPIWDTEASWGRSVNYPDRTKQAAFLAKLVLLQVNQVERFYWYGWDYANFNSDKVYSDYGSLVSVPDLLNLNPDQNQFTITLAGIVHKRLGEWLVSKTVKTCSTPTRSTLWECELTPDSGGAAAKIMWSAAPAPRDILVKEPTMTTALDTGERKTLAPGTKFSVGTMPVLVTTVVLPPPPPIERVKFPKLAFPN